MKKQIIFRDLGLIDYKEAWDYQEVLFKEIIDQKITFRKTEDALKESQDTGDKKQEESQEPRGKNREENQDARVKNQDNSGIANQPTTPNSELRTNFSELTTPNYLLFCEHPHVYTLGKSGSEENLLVNEQQLKEKKATYYKINRGGDITYHGPGQIVGYPILDLDQFFTDIHKYLRYLEEAVILTLDEYGIKAGRTTGQTGVWLDESDPVKARKICAIGVRTSRWVTMHGFAFNVNANLDYFNNIIPCGISDKAVTSMQKELNREVDMEEVKIKLKKHLGELFEANII